MFIFCICVFLIRVCWVLYSKLPILPRTKSCKTMIILGSGGHTGEMVQLIKGLNPIRYNPRIYVVSEEDQLSCTKAKEHEMNIKSEFPCDIRTIPRARRVGQSWSTVPWSVFRTLLASLKMILLSPPDVIICNGPGSCVPVCMVAYIPRILGIKPIRIVYVESLARVKTLSLTGKILYFFADRFIVQWPNLIQRYPRAEYKGILV
ncbi:glycosyltransferase family 1 protein [Phycomyces blakesleeanus NRRL 1555(-)]|uniref:UDP-N-acetylglucosamine transferase subunit ALG14 n=1 Tax=Phycomyces blakesleeanus (strain ATCC 8743b / DSM 1359 / FGSC 10004 / NBRC 33097 / NRRL 1555) TaxID=763407 RepID=A0A162WBJ5_PHYB8|nr:glycosyltransferase family 1 protein [Phycomyces blakesleeanus NRRL 1555(-)]OAD66075.1 glycosyltransferase family 1 protein [Phycomyces blakesleeanus NRRL 1555(-)]|eukprot:XP_018284115.1 glycosyltransferase family 1 protein [Phycomyces blakesleeanus NRRL 1555(-)]